MGYVNKMNELIVKIQQAKNEQERERLKKELVQIKQNKIVTK